MPIEIHPFPTKNGNWIRIPNCKGGEDTLRDLKHLACFEELLREANNALVRQACEEGNLAIEGKRII